MNILKKINAFVDSIPLGTRDDWEQYFMSLCYIVSLRSTCGSRRVGAVLIDGMESGKRRIIATGYNGNPPGAAHCVDGGCPRFEAKKNGLITSGIYTNDFPCDAFHAEHNALIQIMNSNISAKGSVMFSTTFPCLSCSRKMNGAQIKVIYYLEGYPDEQSAAYLKRYGIKAIKLRETDILKKVIQLCNEVEIGIRDEWEYYFMSLAYMVSMRSKSLTERNGAVLIKEKRIISTGYDGYPETEFPDDIEEKSHPEDVFTAIENTLNQIKVQNTSSFDGKLYCTKYPTFEEAAEINGAGIKNIVFHKGAENDMVESYCKRYGVVIRRIN